MQAAKKTSMQYFLGKCLLFQTVFLFCIVVSSVLMKIQIDLVDQQKLNFWIISKYCKKWRRLPNHRGFIVVALTTIELLPF